MNNAILMAFPFLRNVPGSYKNGYRSVINARENMIGKYVHSIKVCCILLTLANQELNQLNFYYMKLSTVFAV